MSIDYYIFNFDGPLPPDEVMNVKGYKPAPMGTPGAVLAEISGHLPQVEWRPAEWGTERGFDGYVADKGYVIEIRVAPNDDGLVYDIAVHQYGIAEAQPAMRRFCVPLGWYVFDPQDGRWLEPSKLDDGKADTTLG